MCGYTCIRYLVFFFNVIFFITGAGLIGTGAYLKVEKEEYSELCDKYSWATGANLLLAVGVIVLVVAFFGCFGAWKQSSILLIIFFVFLLIIFILELAAGIYAATEKSKVEDELKECLNDTVNKGNLKEAWEKFEKEFECCGVDGQKDFGHDKHECATKQELYKDTGCYDKIKDDLKDNLAVVVGVGIAFAVIQILGMVLSLWMVCQIKNGGEVV